MFSPEKGPFPASSTNDGAQPMLADFLTTYKDAFSDGAAVIALIVFCFGVWQFRVGQIWKRNEFLAREIKDFLDDKYVQEIRLHRQKT